METVLLATTPRLPLFPSMLSLRRIFTSSLATRSHLLRLVSSPPVSEFPHRNRLGFRRESLVSPLMASDFSTEDTRRPSFAPLPSSYADKDELFRGLEAALGASFNSEPLSPPPHPLVIVISGPSGVGKDAVIKVTTLSLRVDIQGRVTLRTILGNSAIFIFLVAENESTLVKRLIDRKTETSEMLLVRVATAREEVKRMKDFDYVVVNAEGKLDKAVKLVESIIDAEKARVRQRRVVI
ncbi:hypothetical protein J5N97_014547 [Dioscorea zingiberensis]|uniref:Guanylate kinase-like domain-containing protein n=1 Tax=Dioscorea zingiberensis TaxID=325984 RepID=A0A9D5CVE1_9LILI|nr:hypothetical protein J5N97_014547 [Dioscorea zingiberensis]